MVNRNKSKSIQNIQILSQNVRGVKTDTRLDELYEMLLDRKAIAMCIQETWRSDKEIIENNKQMIITSGLDKTLLAGKRGSQGVAIVLSEDGVIAWKAAGCEIHTDLGARVMALRLLVKDYQNRDVGLFLVSAYAPVGNAAEND